MNKLNEKADMVSSLGSMLSTIQNGRFTTSTDFGKFFCSVENFDHFSIVRRNFETAGTAVDIPFTNRETTVQMMFSLDGMSVFNDRSKPYILSPASHSLNLYKYFDCHNLLEENAHQHDITFRLKKNFYTDLITNHLSSADDRLSAMILQQTEFSTINEHLPADLGIMGLLKNIIDCPFQGEMRKAFIREHIRALFSLQLFYFNPVVTGRGVRLGGSINGRDREILHEVKKYIEENLLTPASIDSLSKHFGINEFKLKHGFKILFNTSPIKYLQYKRLVHGRFLLRETEKSIKQIARELGYTHAANFTIAFTKTFGHPPQHYRTRNQVTEETNQLVM